MQSYLILDLETGCRKVYGRTANPWYNPIVAIGLAKQGEVYSEYIYPNKLENLILQEDVIVGHNLSFDLLYLWGCKDLQDFFKRGGKIWDTSEAEYTLTGQKHIFPALRDIAVNKYGCKEREKKMEAYWEKGIETIDIPKELVIEDVENDVLDTEQVYLKQLEKAKQTGMITLLEERMDFVLATIEMEYNGMYVNKDILETNEKKLQQEYDTALQDFNTLIQKYWK